MDELLKLLDNDARLTNEQLAIMLNCSEEEIRGRIAALEKSGALRAYKAVIDWDKTTRNRVTAIIELKPGHTCTEENIQNFCLKMPRYKRPRKIIFADVPRNATGKIEKPRLREIYCGESLVAQQIK